MKREHLAIVFLSVVWGSTWLAIKLGLDYFPPVLYAGMRFVVASAVLLPLAIKAGRKSLTMPPGLVVLSGFLLIPLPYGVAYWGAQYISSGLTAVLFATLPIFVGLFSIHFLPEERLTWMSILGLAVGFLGIYLIFVDDIMIEDLRAMMGAGAVLTASIVSSLGVVIVKRNAFSFRPVSLTAVHFLLGAVVLVPVGLFTESWSDLQFTPVSVTALLYLALIGSGTAFALYYWLLTRMEATRVSLLVYVTPVIAVYLGWMFLGEMITPQVVLGTALVFGGIKLAS
jgi:drug/metabolite transporter (DMT)-like permease